MTVERDDLSRSVGNEYGYSYKVNGKRLSKGSNLTEISLGQALEIESYIIEDDPSSPDIGSEIATIDYSFLELNEGVIKEQTIRLIEDYGKSAGNVDIYHITYTISCKKHIVLNQTQINNMPVFPEKPHKPTERESHRPIWKTFVEEPELIPSVPLMLTMMYLYIDKRSKKIKKKNKEKENNYLKELRQYNEERDRIIRALGGRTIFEYAGIPSNVVIKDVIPYSKDVGNGYGEFTVFLSQYGKCYHQKQICGGHRNYIAKNIVEVATKYQPCTRCVDYNMRSIPEWYSTYINMRNMCLQYDIPID